MGNSSSSRNSSSSSCNSVLGASGALGSCSGGQVDVDGSIADYFEGGAESTQIIKVKSLKVMKKELESPEKDFFGLKRNFHHEFLLIKVQLTDYEDPVTILAEKNKNSQRVGGEINIRLSTPLLLKGARMKCEIKLENCGQIIVKDLFDDLKTHNLRYSVGMYNCWKYAYDASCKVLKRCEELPDTSDETKEAINLFRERELKKPELLGEYVRPVTLFIIGLVAAVGITGGMIWWGKMIISGPILKACAKVLRSTGHAMAGVRTGAGDPIWWTFGRLSDPSARRVVVEGLGAGITPLQLQSLRNIRTILATQTAIRVSLNLVDIIFSVAVALGFGAGGAAVYGLVRFGMFLWNVTHPEQSSLLADPSLLISENAVQ